MSKLPKNVTTKQVEDMWRPTSAEAEPLDIQAGKKRKNRKMMSCCCMGLNYTDHFYQTHTVEEARQQWREEITYLKKVVEEYEKFREYQENMKYGVGEKEENQDSGDKTS